MLKCGVYKHYKGKNYEVIGVSTHTETLDKYVVYRALDGNKDLWIRPYAMFVEKITLDGVTYIDRFEYIGSEIEV